jgi:hypothetical protein
MTSVFGQNPRRGNNIDQTRLHKLQSTTGPRQGAATMDNIPGVQDTVLFAAPSHKALKMP